MKIRSALPLFVLLVSPQVAIAAQRQPAQAAAMDCLGYPERISIPSMPLSEALIRFRRVYRCGISINAGTVDGINPRDLRSTRIDGRYKPLIALAIMVRHTPLKVRQIRGGFSLYR